MKASGGHPFSCPCESCNGARVELSMGELRMSSLRERANCKLSQFGSPLVEVYADLFLGTILPGYCNPFDHDVRYLEVARIGNAVINEADAKRAAHARRRLERGGRG